eukprot:Nitzschia sp. Nitz4//scaffold171_size48012//30994//33696//NITZ4_007129-RA/size48012-processed-gene-0.15-mRNA-1//-1//CDS//3329538713//7917//frame0
MSSKVISLLSSDDESDNDTGIAITKARKGAQETSTYASRPAPSATPVKKVTKKSSSLDWVIDSDSEDEVESRRLSHLITPEEALHKKSGPGGLHLEDDKPSSPRRILPFSKPNRKNTRSSSFLLHLDSSDDEDGDDWEDSLKPVFAKKGAKKPTASITTSAQPPIDEKKATIDLLQSTTTIRKRPPPSIMMKTSSNTPVVVEIVPTSAVAPTVSVVPAIPPRIPSHIIYSYPPFGSPSQRSYPDLRPIYIRAMWAYSRTLLRESYNLTKLDSLCRRIRDLALSEFPLRSLEEYNYGAASSLFDAGATGTSYPTLQSLLEKHTSSNDDVPESSLQTHRKYCSVVEAALVALLDHVEQRAAVEGGDLSGNARELLPFLSDKAQWIYLADLLPLVDERLDSTFLGIHVARQNDPDNGEAHYSLPSTRNSEFRQFELLTKTQAGTEEPYIKAHRHNKRPSYELTQKGYHKAQYIRKRTFPEPPSFYRTSQLRENDVSPSFQNCCLVVDDREGGGKTRKLHGMCNELDMRKVPYFVTTLKIGDYAFVDSTTGSVYPVIIERKSIQDIAASISDGRWVSQKRRMYQASYVLGGTDHCRLIYIIEGVVDNHELTGGAIGQVRHRVHREQLESEIEQLGRQGFEILRTNNVNGSIAKLVNLTREISQQVGDGLLHATVSYGELLQQIASIPPNANITPAVRVRPNAAKKRSMDPTSPPPNHKTRLDDVLGKKPMDERTPDVYKGWKKPELERECEKWGLTKTGSKADLIARLCGPRPPSQWLQRKQAGLYVPTRYDTCATAILVALFLHQQRQPGFKGLRKEEIIPLAEGLDISRTPFTGTGRGKFEYDGWSCMNSLTKGEAPLVITEKGGRFKLTSLNGDMSGLCLAEAMHQWCHRYGKCKCQELGF